MHRRDRLPDASRLPVTTLPATTSIDDSSIVYKLLNATLIGILAEPESVEPYVEMLTGIEQMVAARAGAVYYFSADTALATPVATTGDMSTASATIEQFAGSLRQCATVPKRWLDDSEMPGLLIKATQIGEKIEQGFVLLVLICDDAKIVRANWGGAFDTLGEGLVDIYRATRQAQVNRRRDLQKERAVIARELHDSLAQSLTYLKIQASRIQSMLQPAHQGTPYRSAEVNLVVHELRDNLNIAYRQLRELMTTFRLTLDAESFDQTIIDSVSEFGKRTAIAFELDNRLGNDDLTVDEQMQVLHIVREALSNIVRHSHARRCHVALRHFDDNSIRIAVNDDGVGIDESQRRSQHLGLIIMQERSRNLGGKFRVRRQGGGGTEIVVTFTPKKNLATNHQLPGSGAAHNVRTNDVSTNNVSTNNVSTNTVRK